MTESRTVLVIGGTGMFGERLVSGLLATTTFHVIAAARDAARLAALVARLGAGRLTTLVLDRSKVTPGDLRATGAFAVVDAAGPFQRASYRLAETVIAAGLHYIDLADARDFVAGFGVLDTAAKAAGVIALTGASSTPALSNAVLDTITKDWTAVHRVDVAISPGNKVPVGLSVIHSILSYAGRPVRVFDACAWQDRPGWGLTVRRDRPGLGKRLLSLVETPDLDVIPARFAVRDAAIFRAGLELGVLHWGLWVAGWPVRLRLLPSLAPLARMVRWMADRVASFGSDRGGMTVDAEGLDRDGRPVRGAWSLVAEAGDGPFVPTLPALAALRALADGRLSSPGAMICAGVLPLAWIEAEFSGRQIASHVIIDRPVSLYERVLGNAFHALPAPLRRLHTPGSRFSASGMARVDGADGPVAQLISAVVGLPKAGNVPVSVEITAAHGTERWTRNFGGRRFSSVLSAAAIPGRLVEQFGPFSFELGLPVGPAGVSGMPVMGWRLGPLPMPMILAPVSNATEDVDSEGRFQFDVEMRLPLGLGRLVRYRGWLITYETRPGAA